MLRLIAPALLGLGLGVGWRRALASERFRSRQRLDRRDEIAAGEEDLQIDCADAALAAAATIEFLLGDVDGEPIGAAADRTWPDMLGAFAAQRGADARRQFEQINAARRGDE